MSTPRNGIIAGGNWIVDAVKIIDVWPQQDTLANIFSTAKGSGGSPFNILVDLAMLGAQFPLSGSGLVGEDDNGRWILEFCAKHGIECSHIRKTTDAPTSFTDVMTVKDSGRRTFFHARGANALLDAPHFDFSKTDARIFHLGYRAQRHARHRRGGGPREGAGRGAEDFGGLRERGQRALSKSRHACAEACGLLHHE
jgi:sugar/nucleoside kinase (ribokinase family)